MTGALTASGLGSLRPLDRHRLCCKPVLLAKLVGPAHIPVSALIWALHKDDG